MTMNPLPPQAYTKDTLLKAYSWLQNQNASIKEMAATPDILVSLYLKATRDGEAVLERPSIQNFKNELKSLAGLMGELEKPPVDFALESPKTNFLSKDLPSEKLGEAIRSQIFSPPAPAAALETSLPQQVQTLSPKTSTTSPSLIVDEKSFFMLQEAKAKLNLSSEQETLRVMIKIAFDRLQNL